MRTVPRNALYGRWVHSHEDDTDTEMVFRPAGFDFPPSRGRFSFELREDGSLLAAGPGPTDRPHETPGRWKLRGDVLTLEMPEASALRRTLHIVSASEDRLVTRR